MKKRTTIEMLPTFGYISRHNHTEDKKVARLIKRQTIYGYLVAFAALILGIFIYYFGFMLSDGKTIIETLQSIIEMAAILIGGLWTYTRFIKTREDYPYPEIQHRIEHYQLEKNIILVNVFVGVENKGKIKLGLGNGKIFVRQVAPISTKVKNYIQKAITRSDDESIRYGTNKELFTDYGQRVGWDELGFRDGGKQLRDKLKELEPGQKREIQFDFLLINDDDVEIIEVISYFEYEKSSWELATLYSLKQNGTSK